MKKWIVILALLVLGYWLNQKIKQLSEHTILPPSPVEKNEDVTEHIPTQVLEQPNQEQKLQKNNTEVSNNYPPQDQTNNNSNNNVNPNPNDDANQWKRDLSGSTLVSCQTQIQHCEPPQEQQYQDGTVSTFCVTYARNCTNPESIQKTWTPDEVFKPEVPQPETNNPIDNYEPEQYQQPQQDYQQPDYQQNQYPQDPIAPVDPSTYLPPMPYAEPPPANHEIVDPPPSEY